MGGRKLPERKREKQLLLEKKRMRESGRKQVENKKTVENVCFFFTALISQCYGVFLQQAQKVHWKDGERVVRRHV